MCASAQRTCDTRSVHAGPVLRPCGAEPIGPRSNALQDLRRLSGRRRARSDAGAFVIDGPTLVAEAIVAAADGGSSVVEAVYAEPSAEPAVFELARDHGIDVVAVQSGALSKVTSPVNAQAVCARATMPPPVDVGATSGLVLVLVEIADPGNAGTLLRVAEAAGATAVLCLGDGVDPWNPKAVRASAGSLFRMAVGVERDVSGSLETLRVAGLRLVAAAGEEATSLDDVDLRGNVAVLLGNEAHGLSPAVREVADTLVAIPMAGRVESLNVAMAGTVIAFESARQRRADPGGHT